MLDDRKLERIGEMPTVIHFDQKLRNSWVHQVQPVLTTRSDTETRSIKMQDTSGGLPTKPKKKNIGLMGIQFEQPNHLVSGLIAGTLGALLALLLLWSMISVMKI